MCRNRSSLNAILAPPLGDGRVRLHGVPLRTRHPGARFQVELPDEMTIFPHMAMQGRMIGLVHRDPEATDNPLGHRSLSELCYHVITDRGKTERAENRIDLDILYRST